MPSSYCQEIPAHIDVAYNAEIFMPLEMLLEQYFKASVSVDSSYHDVFCDFIQKAEVLFFRRFPDEEWDYGQ